MNIMKNQMALKSRNMMKNQHGKAIVVTNPIEEEMK